MNGIAIPQELRETVQMLRGVYKDPNAKLTEMAPDIAKTFGISSGFQPYNLAPYAVILQPVFSPFRNRFPRMGGQGKQFEYKLVTAVNASNATAPVAEGVLSNAVQSTFADVIMNNRSYGLASEPVTFEQLWAGTGKAGDFSIDSRALSVANLLKALMIQEEQLIYGGLGASTQITSSGGLTYTLGGLIGTPTAPTCAHANTGGTVADGDYYVVQTVVTGYGESGPSAEVHVITTGGNLSTITVTPVATANKPRIGYNIYIGTGTGGPYYLVTPTKPSTAGSQNYSTNGAPIVIKTTPATSGTNPPGSDGSGSTLAFNGMLAYMFAGGTNSTVNALNGPITDLDASINAMLETMWTSYNADPDDLWCAAHEIRTISALAVGSGNPYYLQYTPAQQSDIIGRWRVSRYTNPITAKVMPLQVHAYIKQGTMLVTSTTLPPWYVGNNVPGVWAMSLTQDYLEIDYEPVQAAPYWQSEVRCYGGLVCYVPLVNGVITGISP